MTSDLASALRHALGATRAGDVTAATRFIQDALSGRTPSRPGAASVPSHDRRPTGPQKPALRLVGTPLPGAETSTTSADWAIPAGVQLSPDATISRPRRSLGEVIRALSKNQPNLDALGSLPGMGGVTPRPSVPLPDGARFIARSFACAAGARDYKLYIPASCTDGRPPQGLVVMLHGCQQNPDDFALGTGMNALAELHGLVVAYPGQSNTTNPMSCWNWFSPADQQRDAGEPAILAGITREVMSEFGLTRDQVFVAGLSAGGAMAAVLAATYPDLYAAIGVHSGLAYGSASDVVSAFAAMRGDGSAAPHRVGNPGAPSDGSAVRTIVFHGTADRTVHPANAQRIVAAAGPTVESKREQGCSPGGRAYERTVMLNGAGQPHTETWLVEGAGHAWSGGQEGGSYADPSGPDASAAMVRFFLQQQAP